jgi:hypothetical protein
MHYSRSADAVIHVYDAAGNVIETHEYAAEFKRVVSGLFASRHARYETAFRLAPDWTRL